MFLGKSGLLMFVGIVLGVGLTASAVPTLQLYLEGSTYDAGTETWILDGTADIARLWVIGNVAGPGGAGMISDVRLAVAYDAIGVTPTIQLNSSTTGGYGGFTDPSTPATPTLNHTETGGGIPQLTDGSDLPSHGIYGAGTDWQEFLLGDFTETDSPIADFIDVFPTDMTLNAGQINVYEISVSGVGEPILLHFDAYDSVQGTTKARSVFAPFSHDAATVPAPGAAFLGLIGLGLIGWVKRYFA